MSHSKGFFIDNLCRVTNGFLLTGEALGGNDNLIQVLCIFFESNGKRGGTVNGNLSSLVTKVAHYQEAILGSVDGKSAICICQGIRTGIPLHNDSSARNGFPGSTVRNRTFHSDVLCVQSDAQSGENAHQQQTDPFHKLKH